MYGISSIALRRALKPALGVFSQSSANVQEPSEYNTDFSVPLSWGAAPLTRRLSKDNGHLVG